MKHSLTKSPRTSFWGTLAAIGGAVAAFSPEPISKKVGAIAAAVGTSMLGVHARDHKNNDVTPEEIRIRRSKRPSCAPLM